MFPIPGLLKINIFVPQTSKNQYFQTPDLYKLMFSLPSTLKVSVADLWTSKNKYFRSPDIEKSIFRSPDLNLALNHPAKRGGGSPLCGALDRFLLIEYYVPNANVVILKLHYA